MSNKDPFKARLTLPAQAPQAQKVIREASAAVEPVGGADGAIAEPCDVADRARVRGGDGNRSSLKLHRAHGGHGRVAGAGQASEAGAVDKATLAELTQSLQTLMAQLAELLGKMNGLLGADAAPVAPPAVAGEDAGCAGARPGSPASDNCDPCAPEGDVPPEAEAPPAPTPTPAPVNGRPPVEAPAGPAPVGDRPAAPVGAPQAPAAPAPGAAEPVPGQVPAPAAGGVGPMGQNAEDYVPTFSEEFQTLDPNVWNDHMWYEGSNPTKNYTTEDGKLKIWPERDASGNFFNRTVDTDGKFEQQYGYFEMDAKLPVGKGTWPAFWLFAHPGDRRPEIDVMEAYAGGAEPWGRMGADGQPHPTAYAPTIWKDQGDQAGSRQYDTGLDLSADFHKYAVKWEPNKQTFYFDGKEVFSKEVSMSDPMYIMADLWFGSASGQPDDSTPQGKENSFEVKSIKAWQFKDKPE